MLEITEKLHSELESAIVDSLAVRVDVHVHVWCQTHFGLTKKSSSTEMVAMRLDSLGMVIGCTCSTSLSLTPSHSLCKARGGGGRREA